MVKQGADFVGGHKTEIRLRALSALAEVKTGNFGLHPALAGDFCMPKPRLSPSVSL